MVKTLGELKKAIDFYIKEHGENYPVKEVEPSLCLGYKCPSGGWIIFRNKEDEQVKSFQVENGICCKCGKATGGKNYCKDCDI